MWCDGQSRSEPPISANERGLFAGLGAVEGGRRKILTGLFAFLQSFSLESVLRKSEEGTDMMMAFIKLSFPPSPWSEVLCKVIFSCPRQDFHYDFYRNNPDADNSSPRNNLVPIQFSLRLQNSIHEPCVITMLLQTHLNDLCLFPLITTFKFSRFSGYSCSILDCRNTSTYFWLFAL